MTDLILFGIHFGTLQGEAGYSPAADLNADGSIDGLNIDISDDTGDVTVSGVDVEHLAASLRAAADELDSLTAL